MKPAVRSFPVFSVLLLLFAGLGLLTSPPLGAQSTALHPRLTTSEIDGFGPGGLRIAAHPDGGWLLVGTTAPGSDALRALRVAPDGTPGEPVTTPQLQPVQVILEAMAIAPSGRWAAIWYGDSVDFIFDRMRGALFEPNGTLVRELDLTVPDEVFPAERRSAVLGFGPGGELVVAWGARTPESVPVDDSNFVADLFAARFSADGERILGPALVNDVRIGHQRPFGIAVEESRIALAWISWCCEEPVSPGVRLRLLAPDLSPRSGPIAVAQGGTEVDFRTGSSLAAEPGGRLAVAWSERLASLSAEDPRYSIHLRRFEPDGEPLGPEVVVGRSDHRLDAVASPAGVVWITWTGESESLFARPFTFGGMPLDAPRALGAFEDPIEIGADRQGRLLAVGYVEFSLFGPVRIAAVQRTAPPPEHALTSPDVPGFRVWVLITPPNPGAEPIWGAAEPLCIPETLCASGALPGRTEVLVRIVGPKPNGFLWPTLVKLSTSRVEVWIEQQATGELQHYLLPGARPGFDELPGLFDRFGFQPQ